MKLAPLMTVHADLKPPAGIGAGPYGTRLVFDVTGGHFEGARLRGTLLPSGGDWLLIDAEGVGHLDVRIGSALHVMLAKRFHATVDQKRFPRQRRSTESDGHPRCVSTVSVSRYNQKVWK